MAEKMKILVPDANGEMSETIGELMDVVDSKEPWSEYILENGTKIKAKQSVVNIIKLDTTNQDGTPVYIMQGQPVMSVIPKL